MKKYYLAATFLCGFIPLVHAADVVNLDEVVVTATRIEQPLKQTLSSTSVITKEDIKNSQATDVATLLRGVAGVEISQTGGMGKPTSLFLRGSESSQVLVLVDGVRINSATAGTTSIQDIMLDQVERIEVVRGNVSSLYGSEAIGGVVQIFTKQGRGEPKLNVSVGVGNLDTQRLAAGFGGSVNDTNFNFQLSSYKTNGVSALNTKINPNANPDNDGYRNTSASANVHHAITTDHVITFSVFNSLGYNQYDSAYDLPTDTHSNTQKLNKVSLASDDDFTELWHSHVQLAQGVDEYHNYKNDIPTTSSLYKTTNQQLTWQNSLQLDNADKLLVGVENLDQKVDSNTAYTVTQRTVNSLFAGYTGNYGSHQVQTNLRQDNNSQYNTANTGLLGYGYAFNKAWRANASYSTAFRAPTFNDLYWPLSSGYQGNPDLKPEYSSNNEVGLHYEEKNQHIDAVYFDNHIRDMIVSNSTYTAPINLKQVRIDGVEFTYEGRFEDTGIKVALTSQNARDESTGAALVRRAKFHGSLAISQKLGAWQLGGEWVNSGERTDGSHTLASYDVFNLTAAYALNKETKISLRADNMTDQNDATAYGYNPLGRTLFISMSYLQ